MASRVWLITGTTSGFGAEFVKNLLARGDKVIATARDTSKIKHFSSQGAATLELDLSADQSALNQTIEKAIEIYGQIDVVVNNAGYSHFGIFEDESYENTMKQYQTHVFGTMGVARACLPHFRSRKAGTFVFLGSIAAWGGMPALSSYCGSKAALRTSVETFQAETQSLGIRTLLVEPGFFRTELLNSNNARYAETNIDDYKPLTEGLFKQFKQYHQQQPGDPAKGVQRIIDVVKGEGEAAGKDFPTTLALGPDAVDAIRKKCNDTLKLLEEWESLSSSTNFD